jgi:hypothetical protein
MTRRQLIGTFIKGKSAYVGFVFHRLLADADVKVRRPSSKSHLLIL